jgi:hypothetical protein
MQSARGQTVTDPRLRAAIGDRITSGGNLKIFPSWCTDQDFDPRRVGRVDIEHT